MKTGDGAQYCLHDPIDKAQSKKWEGGGSGPGKTSIDWSGAKVLVARFGCSRHFACLTYGRPKSKNKSTDCF